MTCQVCGRPIEGNDRVMFYGLNYSLGPLMVTHAECRVEVTGATQGPVVDRWGGACEYQLANGRWAPCAVLYARTEYDMEEHRIEAPGHQTFASRREAKAFSNSMAARWLREHS